MNVIHDTSFGIIAMLKSTYYKEPSVWKASGTEDCTYRTKT
jgi:hypothetical protein